MKLSKLKDKTSETTAKEVEAYLRQNPEFLHQHPGLLEDMELPHACGDAVSLISRQIELLRQKNAKLSIQLNEILQIARDNDSVSKKIHQLTLSLLSVTRLDLAIDHLSRSIHDQFQADLVSIRLTDPKGHFDEALYTPLEMFSKLGLLIEKPECRRPTAEQIEILFGAAGEEIRSMALIPLNSAELKGFLAIGSRDPYRFDVKMGSLFLSQIGEIVATRLASLLSPEA